MSVVEILKEIKSTPGTNDKKVILEIHKENNLLKNILKYSLDPFMPFNIVKVPKVVNSDRILGVLEGGRWGAFFEAADLCASRELSGNATIDAMHTVFECATAEEERWMRRFSRSTWQLVPLPKQSTRSSRVWYPLLR